MALANGAKEIGEFADLNFCGSEEIINKNEDGTENKSFGRFNMIKTYQIDNEISYQIGLLYAFDLNKPIILN